MNIEFFETIDNEEKAYFLGLMSADGYNCVKGGYFTLGLKSRDVEIIELFQQALGSNYPYVKKEEKDFITVQFNSVKMCQDLANLGCVQAKSLILKFPTQEQVPEHLIHHFIRGYFDGDGSVWQGKRTFMFFKSRPNGRIIHNVKFNITSTPDVVNNIQQILVDKANFAKTKINNSKKLGNIVQLEYSGKGNLEKFYKFLYKDATLFMRRKKDTFEQILNCANTQ